jgi:hypothetical protein
MAETTATDLMELFGDVLVTLRVTKITPASTTLAEVRVAVLV